MQILTGVKAELEQVLKQKHDESTTIALLYKAGVLLIMKPIVSLLFFRVVKSAFSRS